MGDLRSDIWCKGCGHKETLSRALRADDVCPACGGNVYRRRGAPPSPASHLMEVVKSLFTLRGIFFLIGVALFSMAGKIHYVLWIASMVMLTLASLKLATRAMRVGKDGIDFPEVSPEELFDRSALLPAGVFALLFLVLPSVMFDFAFPTPEKPREKSAMVMNNPATGAPMEMPEMPNLGDFGGGGEQQLDPALKDALAQAQKQARAEAAAEAAPPPPPDRTHLAPWFLIASLLLFLYAPMALVMFLRTGSTWALLFVPQGIATIMQDVKAYAGLCLFAVPAFGAKVAIDHLIDALPLYVEPFLLLPRSALILVAWGACGLYVRQRARALDMPVDDDDWVPHSKPADGGSAFVAGLPAVPPRVRPTSISLDGTDNYDPPPVVGTPLPPDKP